MRPGESGYFSMVVVTSEGTTVGPALTSLGISRAKQDEERSRVSGLSPGGPHHRLPWRQVLVDGIRGRLRGQSGEPGETETQGGQHLPIVILVFRSTTTSTTTTNINRDKVKLGEREGEITLLWLLAPDTTSTVFLCTPPALTYYLTNDITVI